MPSLLSSVLMFIRDGLSAAFGTNALAQWTDCSPMAVSATCCGGCCSGCRVPAGLSQSSRARRAALLFHSMHLQALMAASLAPSPFVPINASDPGALHYHPELCYSLASSINTTNPEAAVPQLAAQGLSLDSTAAAAWLEAAVGSTNVCVSGLGTLTGMLCGGRSTCNACSLGLCVT